MGPGAHVSAQCKGRGIGSSSHHRGYRDGGESLFQGGILASVQRSKPGLDGTVVRRGWKQGTSGLSGLLYVASIPLCIFVIFLFFSSTSILSSPGPSFFSCCSISDYNSFSPLYSVSLEESSFCLLSFLFMVMWLVKMFRLFMQLFFREYF